MAKLQIKSETIATFGGIFQIMELFERLGLGKLVDSSIIRNNDCQHHATEWRNRNRQDRRQVR